MGLKITPIPAFRDNYIWLLHDSGHAVVVDPGDAIPVIAALALRHLTLDAILITHHHADHTDGVSELLSTYPATVYAPARGKYKFHHQAVGEGDTIVLDHLHSRLQVIETPGHTHDHVVYYGANCLFCGDTLFGCGCGRLFEGSSQELYHSLQRLAKLPPQTQVFCAHEYTRHNIEFARKLDPDNAALLRRELEVNTTLAQQRPSLPSTIALELATNPFLRCTSPAIRVALPGDNPETIFGVMRELRNSF